jgi:excisionase family DNA binding protein
MIEEFITAEDAASILKLHTKTVQRKAHAGVIPAHKRFSRWYFLRSELTSWLRFDVVTSAPADLAA